MRPIFVGQCSVLSLVAVREEIRDDLIVDEVKEVTVLCESATNLNWSFETEIPRIHEVAELLRDPAFGFEDEGRRLRVVMWNFEFKPVSVLDGLSAVLHGEAHSPAYPQPSSRIALKL